MVVVEAATHPRVVLTCQLVDLRRSLSYDLIPSVQYRRRISQTTGGIKCGHRTYDVIFCRYTKCTVCGTKPTLPDVRKQTTVP